MSVSGTQTYLADLHLHSTASDGRDSPAQLVARAKAQGLTVMALTDHESLGGLKEASQAAKQAGILFIPGVEINTDSGLEVHILLYGVDDSMLELTDHLDAINQGKVLRAQAFIDRFAALGLPITMEDLRLPPNTFCSRPHVAAALVSRGYASTEKEAFEHYLNPGKPGYVPRPKMGTEQVISLAQRLGLVSVLAHPGTIKDAALVTEAQIRAWQAFGLSGIEAYHSRHSDADCAHWDALARMLGLLVTGGSDDHGKSEKAIVGNQMARWQRMQADMVAFISRWQSKQ